MRLASLVAALGNAKTVRNDNSSRFGKYIKLVYDKDFKIMGATTEHFLLEKSRLVHIEKGERNYHFFYQLLAGLDETQKSKLKLTQPKDYAILNRGKCTAISEDVNDSIEFRVTCSALETVGVSEFDKNEMFSLVASFLHLGDIDFEATGESEGGKLTTKMNSSNSMSLQQIAEHLGCDADKLNECFTQRTITGRGSLITVPLDRSQSLANVKGCIKYMYSALFEFLVHKINKVSERSERAFWKTSIRAMKFAKWLQTLWLHPLLS